MGKEGTNVWQDLIIFKRRNCKIPNFQHLKFTIFKFPSSDTSFNLLFATISFVSQNYQILETIFLNHIKKKKKRKKSTISVLPKCPWFWNFDLFWNSNPPVHLQSLPSPMLFCLRGVQVKDIGGLSSHLPPASKAFLSLLWFRCVCIYNLCVDIYIDIYIYLYIYIYKSLFLLQISSGNIHANCNVV